MAVVVENAIASDDQFIHHRLSPTSSTATAAIEAPISDPKSEFQRDVKKLVDLLSNLNPSAKEFFPSSYSPDRLSQSQSPPNNFYGDNRNLGSNDFSDFPTKRNNYNQGKKRFNGRALGAQREDSIRRTVYISDIDQHVTEERLAALFINCGEVVDCRVCGDPHSVLRFAFIEFSDEKGSRAALNLGGTILDYYPIRVLPSKTSILPVNPTFLPRSEDEREVCARTVYCTNIDKKVSQTDIKVFFEPICGEVSRLRLLGDNVHLTCTAFVEFTLAESAIIALNCSGMVLGTLPIRVSPSKTPVRSRRPRTAVH